MGLLTRRRPELASWRADGRGIVSNGDACGGDIQRGDSYSVRFVRPEMPGSLITVTFYAVEYDQNPGEFDVQRQVEWMVCADPSDPGGTEIWSDVACDDLSPLVIDSQAKAEREAREFADEELDAAPAHQWDGQPDWRT